MTPNLSIELKWFRCMDILSEKTNQELEDIIRSIPFVTLRSVGNADDGQFLVRFEYKLSPDLLIVTGVYEETISRLLYNYNQSQRKHASSETAKDPQARKTIHNGFFTFIEAHTKENADNLKGYLRNKKKQMDERPSTPFKVENRRIRIFSATEEDPFTFIVDIMSEYK